jgi:hypothetical protein
MKSKPHRPHPLTRAELARRAGRGRSRITEDCAGALKAACLAGGFVDVAHPSVVAWCEKRKLDHAKLLAPVEPAVGADRAPTKGAKPTKSAPRAPTKSPKAAPNREAKPTPPPRQEGAMVPVAPTKTLAAYAELIDRLQTEFGSVIGFREWLKTRQTIALIREKERKNDIADGRLIEREFVDKHVFGLIDACFRQLLDAPKTITRNLYGMAGSGIPIEEAEAKTREIISSLLELMKTNLIRVLE